MKYDFGTKVDDYKEMFGNSVKIHVNDIRFNSNNEFEVSSEKILALANSLKNQEQLHNIVVYKDLLDDGKKYTLISGETRVRAILYLYDANQSDGYINAVVKSKPKTQLDEKLLIVNANIQRDMTDEDYYFAIKVFEEEYERLKESDNKPEQNKRDYVGSKLGRSGRWVTIIKNKFEGKSEKTKRKEEKEKRSKTKKETKKSFSNKEVAEKIKKEYKVPSVTVSSVAIRIEFDDKDEKNDFIQNVLGIDILNEII